MAHIVLATWNISECVRASWDVSKGIESDPSSEEILENCSEVIDLINRYDVDIICLQEFPTTINGEDILVQKIIDGTDLKYYYGVDTYPTFLVKNGRAGVAVFSKNEILSKKFSFMENPGISKVSKTGKVYYSFDKGVITADFSFGKDQLTVITGHAFSFSPFDAVAEDYPQSFREISRCAIEAIDGQKNVIVLGDFNTERLFDILPELSASFKENLSGPTTVSGVMEGEDFKAGRKLDYFLTSKNVTVKKCAKVKNFSDHYLCICACSF